MTSYESQTRNIPAPDHEFGWAGGNLALDFANTVGGTHRTPTHDHLQGYGDVVRFAVDAGALSAAAAERLKARAAKEPRRAAAVLELGVALRESIYGVFSALAGGEGPTESDLALIGDAAAAGAARSRLVYDKEGLAWSVPPDVDDLERPLWAIARSATDLLMSSERDRVRECASDTCAWVFLDHSRNRSRRWCDMRDCGNREKARRFQKRRRSTPAEGHVNETQAEARA